MTRGTSQGLIRILGHVSAIMVIPILGGAVTGIVVDRLLGTSPLWLLSGFIGGNLVAAAGTWIYIHVQQGRIAKDRPDRPDDR
jgi:F0F1-type ATP synthase assembly protein I